MLASFESWINSFPEPVRKWTAIGSMLLFFGLIFIALINRAINGPSDGSFD